MTLRTTLNTRTIRGIHWQHTTPHPQHTSTAPSQTNIATLECFPYHDQLIDLDCSERRLINTFRKKCQYISWFLLTGSQHRYSSKLSYTAIVKCFQCYESLIFLVEGRLLNYHCQVHVHVNTKLLGETNHCDG